MKRANSRKRKARKTQRQIPVAKQEKEPIQILSPEMFVPPDVLNLICNKIGFQTHLLGWGENYILSKNSDVENPAFFLNFRQRCPATKEIAQYRQAISGPGNLAFFTRLSTILSLCFSEHEMLMKVLPRGNHFHVIGEQGQPTGFSLVATISRDGEWSVLGYL